MKYAWLEGGMGRRSTWKSIHICVGFESEDGDKAGHVEVRVGRTSANVTLTVM